MHRRRAVVALSVLLLTLAATPGGAAVVGAPSEDADPTEDGREKVAEAYEIVAATVADRERIEADLFTALARYDEAAAAIAEAGRRLERISDSLAIADAGAVEVGRQLELHTVAAYMDAVVASPTVALSTESAEDAIVVSELLGAGQRDRLDRLDELLTRRRELLSIRDRHEQELEQIHLLQQELAEDAAELQELFVVADSAVADAFRQAQAAEAAYRAAAEAARAAKARQQEQERRSVTTTASPTSTSTSPTTSPPVSTTSGSTTSSSTTSGSTTSSSTTSSSTTSSSTTSSTTSTTAGSTTTTTEAPRRTITLRPATLAWRPVVEAHFAPDLVDDALIIIQCESAGDPDAVNPYSGAAGLFQFMPGTWAVASVKAGVGDRSIFDGEANTIAASWLAEYYRSRGKDPWAPWSCRSYL